ncbi:MAG: hypothetical protein NTX45_26615 [Proteobacteria bacterium]|nr:hypothetical protein [Pseudomonadota bacterium]
MDRNDGNGFVFLIIHTEPNTPAPAPLPGTSVVWKYKAIYRYHDEQVGEWSDVLSVVVGDNKHGCSECQTSSHGDHSTLARWR